MARSATRTLRKTPRPQPQRPVVDPEERRVTIERMGQLFAAHPWIFAKTMPDNPHEYSPRKNWSDQYQFEWCVEQIDRLGFKQKFNGSTWTVLVVDGYLVWAGWQKASHTHWINRKPVSCDPGVTPANQ